MERRWWACVATTVCIATVARADVVRVRDIRSPLYCTVVQDAPTTVALVFDDGLYTFDRSSIETIERTPAVAGAFGKPRISPWRAAMIAAGAAPWSKTEPLRQIPATVIDIGVLRHVPYKSHRLGSTYELNVYGDPNAPAGVEIGFYPGPGVDSPRCMINCLALAIELLGNQGDIAILKAMSLAGDKVDRNGLSMEITPPSAPDSYGGWWISVYDQAKLDKERASDAEITEISDAFKDLDGVDAAPQAPSQAPDKTRTATPGGSGGNAATSTPAPLLDSGWRKSDFQYSKRKSVAPTPTSAPKEPEVPATPSVGSDGGGGGGRVYVRGYTRKDGTYVSPHSRRR